MVATSMGQLQAMIMAKMRAAMQVSSTLAEADMHEEVGNFYGSGDPVLYQRTGAMMNTPTITGVTGGGTTLTFKAYLNDSGGYSTGKQPSMNAVLNLANYGAYGGLRPTAGTYRGFWEKSEVKIRNDVNRIFASFFG